MDSSRHRDIKWADGLRGIAGVLVVVHHLRISFAQELHRPASGVLRPTQFPLLYICVAGGNFCVSVFFMLSGFVCSIKALRLAREGKVEECRAIIGDSTVKRVMRLVFPASCATVVSWCTAQTGGYELARGRGSYWLTQTAERTEGIYPSIKALCMSCWNTWVHGGNQYDGNQWTLKAELLGSLWVYTAIFATASFNPLYRAIVLGMMALISFSNTDTFYTGYSFFIGALLADLSLILPNHSTPGISRIKILGPIILAAVGIVIGSYPDEAEQKQAWTRQLWQWGNEYFAGHLLNRLWPTIGTTILLLAIVLSPLLRKLLSHPRLVFLGSISYAIYLLHSTLIHSLLTWIILGLIPQPWEHIDIVYNEEGHRNWIIEEVWSMWMIVELAVIVAWMGGLVWVASWWKRWVEGWCFVFSGYVYGVVTGKRKWRERRTENGVASWGKEHAKVSNIDVEKG